MLSEKELYLLLINNPEKGIEKIMDQYIGYVYTIVYGKLSSVCNKQDIEECVSDIFYEIYRTRSNIDLEKGSLKAYLAVISKRKAIDDFRRLRNRQSDVHNEISITTVTNKIEEQLIVWCYPLRANNATQDIILRYGQAQTGAFEISRYIETEEGQIFSTDEGWQINNRMIFDMPDIAIQCSLGTIRLTQVQREPNLYESDKDTVWIKFAFDSHHKSKALSIVKSTLPPYQVIIEEDELYK